MKLTDRVSADTAIAALLLVAASLSVIFLGSLVAPPKLLFGRSMTAISPMLFPRIVLVLLAILCAFFLVLELRKAATEPGSGVSTDGWLGGLSFFALMTFYALAMAPLGFLISSALTLAAFSWLVGNRSVIQIVFLALASPIALYLVATRLLAVSLPEQDFIELFIARMFN